MREYFKKMFAKDEPDITFQMNLGFGTILVVTGLILLAVYLF